eukprot:TRINITY_DN685_c0_g4_i2.p1 TRINITY_DN685_c0_g4~~TRINITY_DN685_c0_g4_i2.p1  ORF type:complete len:1469 (+),score=420.73 TRINITY_DN685_c0_g4_i2:95-4501(+)
MEVSSKKTVGRMIANHIRTLNRVDVSEGDEICFSVGNTVVLSKKVNCDDISCTPGSVMEGHKSWVRSVDFSPDGRFVATASDDNLILLWDVESASIDRELKGHTDVVRCVRFSPEGTFLASSSEDRTVKVWAMPNGVCRGTLSHHTAWVYAIAFSPNLRFLFSASKDKTIVRWELYNAVNPETEMTGHSNTVTCVEVSPCGTCLASGSMDETIRIWDTETTNLVGILRGHTSMITSLSFSPCGSYLFSSSGDGTLRKWDVANMEVMSVYRGHEGYVWSVHVSYDGLLVASASEDRTIRIWCAQKTLEGTTTDPSPSLSASPSASASRSPSRSPSPSPPPPLSSSSTSSSTSSSSSMTVSPLCTIRGHANHVWGVRFSPSQEKICSVSVDTTVRFWNLRAGEFKRQLTGHKRFVQFCGFSKDGKYIGAICSYLRLLVWEAATGAVVRDIRFSVEPGSGAHIGGFFPFASFFRLWTGRTMHLIGVRVNATDVNRLLKDSQSQEWIKSAQSLTIDFSDSPIGDLGCKLLVSAPANIVCRLRNLSLRGCGITDIPWELCRLPSLETLDLIGNHISRFPMTFCSLRASLRSLALSIDSLPYSFRRKSYAFEDYVVFGDHSSMSSQGGPRAKLERFFEWSSGDENLIPMPSIPVHFVGHPFSGKTTLVRALLGELKKEDMHKRVFSSAVDTVQVKISKEFRMRFLDYSGKRSNYAAHEFFLQSLSGVYVITCSLLWDELREQIAYWLCRLHDLWKDEVPEEARTGMPGIPPFRSTFITPMWSLNRSRRIVVVGTHRDAVADSFSAEDFRQRVYEAIEMAGLPYLSVDVYVVNSYSSSEIKSFFRSIETTCNDLRDDEIFPRVPKRFLEEIETIRTIRRDVVGQYLQNHKSLVPSGERIDDVVKYLSFGGKKRGKRGHGMSDVATLCPDLIKPIPLSRFLAMREAFRSSSSSSSSSSSYSDERDPLVQMGTEELLIGLQLCDEIAVMSMKNLTLFHPYQLLNHPYMTGGWLFDLDEESSPSSGGPSTALTSSPMTSSSPPPSSISSTLGVTNPTLSDIGIILHRPLFRHRVIGGFFTHGSSDAHLRIAVSTGHLAHLAPNYPEFAFPILPLLDRYMLAVRVKLDGETPADSRRYTADAWSDMRSYGGEMYIVPLFAESKFSRDPFDVDKVSNIAGRRFRSTIDWPESVFVRFQCSLLRRLMRKLSSDALVKRETSGPSEIQTTSDFDTLLSQISDCGIWMDFEGGWRLVVERILLLGIDVIVMKTPSCSKNLVMTGETEWCEENLFDFVFSVLRDVLGCGAYSHDLADSVEFGVLDTKQIYQYRFKHLGGTIRCYPLRQILEGWKKGDESLSGTPLSTIATLEKVREWDRDPRYSGKDKTSHLSMMWNRRARGSAVAQNEGTPSSHAISTPSLLPSSSSSSSSMDEHSSHTSPPSSSTHAGTKSSDDAMLSPHEEKKPSPRDPRDSHRRASSNTS